MSSDVHWITALIIEAQKRNPPVTNAVSARLSGLLKGQLSERQLPSGELASLARALIADMVPAPPKVEGTQ